MKVEGVKDVKASAKEKSVWIKYDRSRVKPEKLVETINTKTSVVFRSSRVRNSSRSSLRNINVAARTVVIPRLPPENFPLL